MATPNLKVDKSQRIDAKRNGWRTVGLTAILGIGLIVFVFPFYWLLVASTRKSTDVFSKTPHMIPGTELFNNIRNLMTNTQFGDAIVNSLIVSVTYVIVGGVICSLAGYAFAQTASVAVTSCSHWSSVSWHCHRRSRWSRCSR